MKLENLAWLLLLIFWVIFGIVCLVFGEYLTALLAAGALLGLTFSFRTDAIQRQRIRHLRCTVASLEQALKEAHRRDPR